MKEEVRNARRKAAAKKAATATATPAKVAAGAEQPPIPEAEHERNLSVTTFGALGSQFPIGYLQGGQLHTGFVLRAFRMKEERELGALKRPGISLADFVTSVMAHMFRSLGPWTNFEALSESERRLIIGQMYWADVLYAYFQLRILAVGKDVKIDLRCPACRHKWRWSADLTLTDVVTATGPDSLVWRHRLRDGLPTPQGKEIHELVLQPPRWHAATGFQPSPDGLNMGAMKLHMIASAVRGHDAGDDVQFTPDFLDGLSKYDLEMLTRELDADTPGADLELVNQCEKCGHEFSHILDWNWDFFFGASSL